MKYIRKFIALCIGYALILSYATTITPAETPSGLFSDVTANAGYAQPVEALAKMDIFSGYPGGTFHPDQPITRAEMVAIATRIAGY